MLPGWPGWDGWRRGCTDLDLRVGYLQLSPLTAHQQGGRQDRRRVPARALTPHLLLPSHQEVGGQPGQADVGSLRHPDPVLTPVGDVEVLALEEGGGPGPGLVQSEGDQLQTTALPLAPPQSRLSVAPLHRPTGPVALLMLTIPGQSLLPSQHSPRVSRSSTSTRDWSTPPSSCRPPSATQLSPGSGSAGGLRGISCQPARSCLSIH